jgi:hypothetical protein
MQALARELRHHARILNVAAISLGVGRALPLGLRIADSLGQHLAKLGLSLWRFARERRLNYCEFSTSLL